MTIPFQAEVMKTISSEELLFPTEERKKLKYKKLHIVWNALF